GPLDQPLFSARWSRARNVSDLRRENAGNAKESTSRPRRYHFTDTRLATLLRSVANQTYHPPRFPSLTHGNGVTISTGLVEIFSPRMFSKTVPYTFSILTMQCAAMIWWTRPWLFSCQPRPLASFTSRAPGILAAASCFSLSDTSGPSMG